MNAVETEVEWREWGPEPFAEARREGEPVLLSMTTPWAAECREMDRETFGDPQVAAHVNDDFVPVRVNADRHPRVRERYNVGGFPATVFLTPEGAVITGATYLGVDGFREILDAVRSRWTDGGEDAGSVPRPLEEATPPGGRVSDDIERQMLGQLQAAFDEEYGGWGTDVKFPLARTVEFALLREREQAVRTLEAVRTHLLDTYEGGFFRYATTRKWGQPRREKLLDENAALVRAFAHAYRYTGEDAYREAADRAVEYLTSTLWTDDAPQGDGEAGAAFASSQAGDEAYYRRDATERESTDAPPVDATVFADRNGLAVDACLQLSAYTDDERPRRYAERALSHVETALVDDGAVVHYRTDDEEGPRGLLADQAAVLQALTSAWAVLGESGPAEAVADWTAEHLLGDDGAFLDGPVEGPGLLDRPLYPLDQTVELADALVDLAALAGEDRYRRLARDAVAAYADASDRMGVEVAHFATVAARLERPRSIAVGTAAGTDLHRAALRLADHETAVVPDAPRAPDGAAILVRGGETLGPAETPAALETLVTDKQ